MPTPKKRKAKKVKGKVKVSTRAKVVRKDSVRVDTLPKAPTRIAGDNGANLRIKIRRK